MGLMSGARSISRNWARGFYEAYSTVHGFRYPSSMYANAPVVLLNDRAEQLSVIPEQAIRYPTDFSLLNEARQFSEQIIDKLYPWTELKKKPRIYPEKAR